MSKTYILVYDDELGNRETIKRFVDSRPEIISWRYDLPNSFYLISDLEARALFKILFDGLDQQSSEAGSLLLEITENRQGWLARDTWRFIRRTKNGNGEEAS